MSRLIEPSVPGDIEIKIRSILRAAAYVEDHLQELIRIGDMAEKAGYSIFHFCRIFNAVTGHSPYDYQIKRKLSEALPLLSTGKASVTRVALEFGFETPEGFSRAFKRMFGILPSGLKNGAVLDPRLSLLPVTRGYLSDLHSCNFKPARGQFDKTEYFGITDHHARVAESLQRSRFDEGMAVIDYHPDWETKGIQIFLQKKTAQALKAVTGGGSYIVFSPGCPVTKIDSFLYYIYSVFCRLEDGPESLPTRIILKVTHGVVTHLRFAKYPKAC